MRFGIGILVPLLLLLVAMIPNPVQAADDATLTVETNWSRYGVLQTDLYTIQAEAGTLTVTLLNSGEEPAQVGVLIIDEAADELLEAEEPLVLGQTTITTTLPRAGSYILIILDNRLTSLTVSAPGLQLAPGTPALAFPSMVPFATRNEPFDLLPVLHNVAETEWIALYIDGDEAVFDFFNPDGTLGPQTVDTSALADDIYLMELWGKALDAENYSTAEMPILIDREDAFPDVPASHWARRYIEVMHHLGLINGRPEGYVPGDSITRAEFAKLLAVTLELEAAPDSENPFADVAGHWAEEYILALYANGLVVGDLVDGKRFFYPQNRITRAEATTMLGRALEVADGPVSGLPFADWAQIPDWARPSVSALVEMGWINGFPDGNFLPGGLLQRDQAAKILAKFLGM